MTATAIGNTMNSLSHDQMFMRAVRIATNAHRGQTCKDGRPYIEHCERVAMRVEPALRPIAYLHDVIEKSEGWTLERLRLDAFPEEIIGAVDALTKRASEEDEALVRRAAANPLALPVKKADLEDNLQSALRNGEDADKYRRGLEILHDEFQS